MAIQIYLDNNATTMVDPFVLDEMIPYFTSTYGNASSTNHVFGKKASAAVQKARENVANLLEAKDDEIMFTSGATESINLAVKGIYKRYGSIGNHIISCVTEHKSVLDVLRLLEKKGAKVTYLPVNRDGNIDLEDLRKAITDKTILISLMFANNETGVIHPVEEIARIAQENNVLFFCDATQAIGKMPVSVEKLAIDVMALSAHKIYGPKGVGALYVRKKSKKIQLEPLIHGGGQEKGLRGGTYNVPGIVGLGTACAIANENLNQERKRLKKLRNYLETALLNLEETFVNGRGADRLPNVSNIAIRFIKGEQLMASLKNVAMSAGSACATGSLDPSHVLMAMGLDKEDAHSSLRFSLGRFNTEAEIDLVIDMLNQKIKKLRAESPAWELYKKGLIV
ncbi:cysteine desulfurase family protein [Albibacterium indicum]|uniref:cysteine desulfurase family protein n=1 Tax=Albibacterium indicum TaxID=2292082 RepID=UPI000E529119|nr:cysteine desulfurase family protein [Pedobacter indicus]